MPKLYIALSRTLIANYGILFFGLSISWRRKQTMVMVTRKQHLLLQRLQQCILFFFLAYMLYTEIYIREPHTLFKVMHKIPPKLCPLPPISNRTSSYLTSPQHSPIPSVETNNHKKPDRLPFGLEPSHPFYPYWEEYLEIHRNMTSVHTPIEKRRFVVFDASNDGLGNRIQGLLSTFLYALLTKRAFVVLWSATPMSGGALDDLFESPGFEWRFNRVNHLMYQYGYSQDSSQRESFWVPYCRVCAERLPPTESSIYSKLLCQDHFGVKEDVQVVWIRSTQYYAPALTHNPYYRAKLCEMFKSADVFGPLARALLRPIPALRDRIMQFREQYFDHGQVIGLQIRKLESPNSITEEQEEVFLRCAQQLSPTESTKWLLLTDDIDTRERWKNIVGDRLIVVDEPIVKSSKSGVQHALVENWLLGEANEVITTPYSTFGYVGHARTGKVPHVVTHSKHCVKMLSPEPCFQYWFGMLELPCWQDNFMTSEMINQEECLF